MSGVFVASRNGVWQRRTKSYYKVWLWSRRGREDIGEAPASPLAWAESRERASEGLRECMQGAARGPTVSE